MDKSGYGLLFQEAIQQALQLAGLSFAPSDAVVEFHGRPSPDRLISVDEALDFLWLSEDRFYLVVDVAAISGEESPPVLFVRPAGFEPGNYEDTWRPSGVGPFKVMGPMFRGRG